MKYIGFTIVILFAIILLIPLVWMISGSFQPGVGLMKIPPAIISTDMTLKNYRNLFEYPVLLWLRNSLVVSVLSVCITIPINIMAGYAFAKKKFYGKEILFNLFLFTMVIPSQITLIPSFFLIRTFGLYNTLTAMWLPSGVSAFMLYFFRQYLIAIPNDFLDIATIEGCGELGKFVKIIIPLSAPAIVTMTLINFIGAWGNFLWQLIVVSRDKLYTLPVGTAVMLLHKALNAPARPDYGLSFAAASFAFAPIFLLFIFTQRWYLKGLFTGAIKG